MYFGEIFTILENDEEQLKKFKYKEFSDLSDKAKKEIEGRTKILDYKSFKDLPINIQNKINKQAETFARTFSNTDVLDDEKKEELKKYLFSYRKADPDALSDYKIKKDIDKILIDKNISIVANGKSENIDLEKYLLQKKKAEIISRYISRYKERGGTQKDLTLLHNLENHKAVFQNRINKKYENIFGGDLTDEERVSQQKKVWEERYKRTNAGRERLDRVANANFNKKYDDLKDTEKDVVFNQMFNKIDRRLSDASIEKIKGTSKSVNIQNAENIVKSYPSVKKSSNNSEIKDYSNNVVNNLGPDSSLEEKIAKGDIMTRIDQKKPFKLNNASLDDVLGQEDLGLVDKKKKKINDNKFREMVKNILNNRSFNPLIKVGDINNNNFQHLTKVVRTGSEYGKGSIHNLSIPEKIAKDVVIYHMEKNHKIGKRNKYFNEPDLNNEKVEEGFRMQMSSYYKKVSNITNLVENLTSYADTYNDAKTLSIVNRIKSSDKAKALNDIRNNIPSFYVILKPGVVQPAALKNDLPNISKSKEIGPKNYKRDTKGIDGIGYNADTKKIFFVENKASQNPKHYKDEIENFIKNCANAGIDHAIWNFDGHYGETSLSNYETNSSWPEIWSKTKDGNGSTSFDKLKSDIKYKFKNFNFDMMKRMDFNKWLVRNEIPSIHVNNKDSLALAEKFKTNMRIFLASKGVKLENLNELMADKKRWI